MIENSDIRWMQRFSNYRKALERLEAAVGLLSRHNDFIEELDDLMKEGLIQRFEYTHELAWKVMKDYETYQGYTDITGSRDAIRKALEMGIISDRRWMDSIQDRNLTSHNYDNETADEIYQNIVEVYYPLFKDLETKLLKIVESELMYIEKFESTII